MSPRRRKGGDSDADGLRWLTTYGDVVTLLLAFFVLLYAISQVDQQKFQLFVSGLEAPFGNPVAATGLLSGETGVANEAGEGNLPADPNLEDVDDGLGLIDGGQRDDEGVSTTVPPSTTSTVTSTTTTLPEGPSPGAGYLRTAEDLQNLSLEVQGNLEMAGLADVVDIEIDTRGLVIAIATDDVLFASGSTQISVAGREIVDVIAPSLTGVLNRILVEGHTDDVPLLRAGYDNWNLSTDRAVAVLRVLLDDHGVDPARLVASGYGEYRPRDDNSTAEGRSHNRRVELVIVAETE
jgi:chemotaxis protein MotB